MNTVASMRMMALKVRTGIFAAVDIIKDMTVAGYLPHHESKKS